MDEPTMQAILNASKDWLKFVDAGNFVEALNEAAEDLGSRISPQLLEAGSLMWNSVRGSNRTFSREFKSIRYIDAGRPVPRSDYVLVEYETKVDGPHEKPYREVTPMVFAGGEWKIWDYYFMTDQSEKADGPTKLAAFTASQNWLALVDADNFAEAWARATKNIRPWFAIGQFESSMKSFIAKHGKPQSRHLKVIHDIDQPLHSPPLYSSSQRYISVAYETRTDLREEVQELITLVNETGEWRVWSYNFKAEIPDDFSFGEQPPSEITGYLKVDGKWKAWRYHFIFNQLDEQTRRTMLAVSQSWLELLDANDFEELYRRGSNQLRSQINPQQFEAVRKSFVAKHGRITSRIARAIRYTDSLSDQGPKGEYFVIDYEAKLEHEEKPVAASTPLVFEEGEWKVEGHFYSFAQPIPFWWEHPPWKLFPRPTPMQEQYNESTYGDRIAEVYDRRVSGVSDETIARLKELAGEGPVLELGIGTGRLALPLSQQGIEVHGIDASTAMVAKLAAKPGGGRIPVTIGNFADVGVKGSYSLIFVVFNTIFALGRQEEQVRCFANVAKRLRPGGLFLIEAFVPDPARFKEGQLVKVSRIGTDGVDLETSQHDPLNQRVVSQHVVIDRSGMKLYPVEIRYAWPAELDLMAQLAGMRLRERWSTWRRDPFVASSANYISIYEAS